MRNKFFKTYNRIILGENRFADVRKRLFVMILWVSLLFALVGNIVNIGMGFNTQLVIITFIAIAVLGYLYLKLRFSPSLDYEKYIYIYWGCIAFFIPINWILNAGVDGNISMLLFISFVSLFFTIKISKRYLLYLFFVVIIVALVAVDHFLPNTIIRYSNSNQRFVDLIVGYPLYFTLLYSLLNALLKNQEFEQSRLNLRNKQLGELSKKSKVLNEKLERTVRELEQSNYSKDRFISIIAHDLRSPFQGMLGISNILEEDYENLDKVQKKDLIVKLNFLLEKQYKFLDELLLWGRIQRNAVKILNEKINVKELIGYVINIFEESLQKKRISINLFAEDKVIVETDKNLLSTIIRNLISNAIKFSVFGGIIDIKSYLIGNKLSIIIQDYGIGMCESDLDKLFKVEENISRKGTDGESGSGLGLIICKEIINKLNGKIIVNSKEGVGTTFQVYLPRNLNETL